MGRFSFSRRRTTAPEVAEAVVTPPNEGAALLHRISVALETPRLSTHGYPQVPPGLPLQRSNSRAVSSTLTLPTMTANQTPTTATTPTDPHNPYSSNHIAISTPELPPTSRPGIGKKRISMQYLNPFAARSKATLEPTPTSSPTLADVTNSPASEKRADDAKLKKKLSKRQPAPLPPTSTSLKNLLTGTPVSQSSHGNTGAADLHRAKKVASSQARLVPLLLHEEEANKLIVEVRQLSPIAHYFPSSGPGSTPDLNGAAAAAAAESSLLAHPPAVRAVCLAQTDEETDEQFLSKIPSACSTSATDSNPNPSAATIASSLDTLTRALSQLKVINFLQFGPRPPAEDLTSPSDSDDASVEVVPPKIIDSAAAAALDLTLLGALPSPKTVEAGVDEMAKQMIALGLGNPSALLGPSAPKLEDLLPSHAGVYPPEDRMSVITCEWGYELVLPEPSIRYLSKVKSIEGTVLNFLTIFSMMSGGIREIMPFIRYAAQYVDIEWAAIKAKDKGKGVVCAATWLMPAALVARAWDFPSLTPEPEEPEKKPWWHWWSCTPTQKTTFTASASEAASGPERPRVLITRPTQQGTNAARELTSPDLNSPESGNDPVPNPIASMLQHVIYEQDVEFAEH